MKKGELNISSLGMRKGDISIDAINTLKESDCVISNFLDLKAIDMLKKLGVKNIINLQNRNEDDIIKIIKRLFKRFNKISYLTWGNPLFLHTPTFNIFKSLEKEVKIKITPAVSSLDYVIDMIIKKFKKEIKSFLIITQPDEITPFPLPSDSNVVVMYPMDMLKDHRWQIRIKEIYPENHIFYLIKFKEDITFKKSFFLKYSISNLSKVLEKTDHATTLFIPAIKKK